ncbi:hypothetical protein, partial [Nonomuraea sp. B19D2]|uniref:hypothetical protein n=1 Tax=Nonomuraea sp. B19D2 TaxID=3159561 RepID=UPI0032D9BB1D
PNENSFKSSKAARLDRQAATRTPELPRLWSIADRFTNFDPEPRALSRNNVWKPIPAGDANVPPLVVRLLRTVAERQRWRAHMAQLQAQADGQDPSATEDLGRAA